MKIILLLALLVCPVTLLAQIAAPAIAAHEILQAAGKADIRLKGKAKTDGKGIQAFVVVTHIQHTAVLGSEQEWVELPKIIHVRMESLRRWPEPYEGKLVEVDGRLTWEETKELGFEEVRELLEGLGLDGEKAIKVKAGHAYSLSKYAWSMAAPKGFDPDTKIWKNGIGMDFVKCPPGAVTDQPVVWFAATELTSGQWQEVMGIGLHGTSLYRGIGDFEYPKNDVQLPMTNITYREIEAYCINLTARERSNGVLPAGWSYCIPTFKEWVYVCRAGSKWGKLETTKLREVAWLASYEVEDSDDLEPPSFTSDDSPPPLLPIKPVAQLKPNPWGIFDILGNVSEICSPDEPMNENELENYRMSPGTMGYSIISGPNVADMAKYKNWRGAPMPAVGVRLILKKLGKRNSRYPEGDVRPPADYKGSLPAME